MIHVLTQALRCLLVVLVSGVVRCASRGRRLELTTNSAQVLNIVDQILEEGALAIKPASKLRNGKLHIIKLTHLVLPSELSFLVTHDGDQALLLSNEGIFTCDYDTRLPELCLHLQNIHS